MEVAGDPSTAATKAVKDVSQALADIPKLIKKLAQQKEAAEPIAANINPEEPPSPCPQVSNRPFGPGRNMS